MDIIKTKIMSKRQLLDPIGTLCRLIMLNFKPVNTKIGIYDHAIFLHEPSKVQGAIRFLYGFDKDDVSELFDVVVRIIQWYVLPLYEAAHPKNPQKIKLNSLETRLSDDNTTEQEPYKNCFTVEPKTSFGEATESVFGDDDNESVMVFENPVEYFECMSRLIKYLCTCFETLQKTYLVGNVVMTLQLYINLLQDSINGKFDDQKLPKCLIEREQEARNFLDYRKIKVLWDFKKVKEVCELYDRCILVQNDVDKVAKTEGYLLAVDRFLALNESGFRNLIQSSNSG